LVGFWSETHWIYKGKAVSNIKKRQSWPMGISCSRSNEPTFILMADFEFFVLQNILAEDECQRPSNSGVDETGSICKWTRRAIIWWLQEEAKAGDRIDR
jgi:hypothetical protein